MNNETSRNDLLQWMNDTLKLNINRIEMLGNGAVFCQLFDAVHPGKLQMHKINWKAKQEYEFVSNFKLLQQAFTKLGISRPIEVERLTKCKYQDNLEFLQWFRRYIDSHCIPKDYDPQQRRNNQEVDEADRPAIRNGSKNKSIIRQKETYANLSKNSSYSTIQAYNQEHHQLGNKENNQIMPPKPNKNDLSMQIDSLKTENQFYYQKFKDLDQLMESINTDEISSQQLYMSIKEILYATADKSITVLNNGELEIGDNLDDSKVDDSKTNDSKVNDSKLDEIHD